MGLFSKGESSSNPLNKNYSGEQTSGGNSPLTAGEGNKVVMGNETSVRNNQKTNVNSQTNSHNTTSVKSGGTINYITNNAADAIGILDKVSGFLSTNLGGSGGGSGSGGTYVGYSPPPAVASEAIQSGSTSSTIKWVSVAALAAAGGAFWLLSKKKKKS